MLDVFKAASQSILAALGEDAFLRGTAARINIEHGVQIVNDDQRVTERDIATIDSALSPRHGDRLVHPDGTYDLDTLYQDTGVFQRWVLRSRSS